MYNVGTPEEIKSNQTLINLQEPASFLKPLLKMTNGKFQNREWHVATKNSNWEKSQDKDGQCSWNSFNSWRPAPNSYVFFALDIPDASERWLGTYYSCPLQLHTCVTMRTCISSCTLKTPCFQIKHLSLNSVLRDRRWSLLWRQAQFHAVKNWTE